MAKNAWHCFGCRSKGNALDLAPQRERKRSAQAGSGANAEAAEGHVAYERVKEEVCEVVGSGTVGGTSSRSRACSTTTPAFAADGDLVIVEGFADCWWIR